MTCQRSPQMGIGLKPDPTKIPKNENYDEHRRSALSHDVFGFTLISDQQKGLEKVVRELLPLVKHRFCGRHLSSNLTKKHPSEAVKIAFWSASTTTHPEAFKSAMIDLERHSKGAAAKMKYMPLIDMLTENHDMIMERLHKKRYSMKSIDCVVLPNIKKELNLAIRDSNDCRLSSEMEGYWILC
ncbi:hypothetical protein POM88_033897 [Heracleum sosnowskyi]|uniref:MULE transposase domain-containing protein n=1 Tax=Heracleum sosnowskyi TaxID=360622 RepID=A0AAD8HI89_9APIA|nr:hypothetical protein POM88_033897 [Heracleum sosnowskyi]